jgi:AraC-like DNA-binding protein
LNPCRAPVKYAGYNPQSRVEPQRVVHPTIDFGFVITCDKPERVRFADGVRHSAAAPCLSFNKPGVVYESFDSFFCEQFYFCYDASLLDNFKVFCEEPFRPLRPLDMSGDIPRLINMALGLCRNIHSPGEADRLDLICLQIVNELVIADKVSASAKDPRLRGVYEIASYVETHYMDNIDWNALIKKHGFSRRTFLRLWENTFGKPPGQYVAGLKVNEAKRLLASGESVGAVAEKLGFEDPFYFSRLFRKHSGMSPAEYKKTAAYSS